MSADLIARLIEAGTPPTLVAEVAMALGRAEAAARPDSVADRRRAWDRDYRAAKRAEARSMSGGSGGSRVDNADSADTTPAPSLASSPNPSITPTLTPGDTPRARKAAPGWPVPDGVDPEHWRDLLANRKSKRLPNTPTAHKRLLSDLAKLSDDEWPPGRIIEHAAARGWGAIFDPRDRHDQRHRHGRSGQGARAAEHPGGRDCAAFDRVFGGMES